MITLARVRAEAAKAVAEMGRDFRYNQFGGICFYYKASVGAFSMGYYEGTIQLGDPKTKTPCIIGRMLESMHLMTDDIRYCTTSVTGLFGPKSEGSYGTYEGVFEPSAVAYMSRLQVMQDRYEEFEPHSHSWGECYDSVEEDVQRGRI